ncbi:MAG TPA: hypothetical protein H9903_11830 [Candidatus Aquabacterium excrementipullorum]|nr:hypothetical protein [Candidatus Aquabacterium excrementipullorum]
MIHHFARALAVREQARVQSPMAHRAPAGGATAPANVQVLPLANRLRIRRDPTDARRTVIAGRFADVCAALDRMAAELETAA